MLRFVLSGLMFFAAAPAFAGAAVVEVPEPMSMALLAAGAVGAIAVRAYRRRR